MTNEQNIIAVPVPVDATDIGLNIPYNNHVYYSLPDDDEDGFQERKFVRCRQIIPNSGIPYKFLGCVSFKDGWYDIDFDPDPFVEGENMRDESYFGFSYVYKNYMDDSKFFRDTGDSFISLLQSMGHYWVNPLGEECPPDPTEEELWNTPELDSQVYQGRGYDQDMWRVAESKRLRPDQKLAVMKIGE